MEENDKIFWNECHQIIGAAYNVHHKLGTGFLEAVYQEALSIEFTKLELPFEAQKGLSIDYDGFILQKHYIADFFCFDKIIVEIKATEELCPEHTAQVINYLKATHCKCGLLINFGESRLHFKKILN